MKRIALFSLRALAVVACVTWLGLRQLDYRNAVEDYRGMERCDAALEQAVDVPGETPYARISRVCDALSWEEVNAGRVHFPMAWGCTNAVIGLTVGPVDAEFQHPAERPIQEACLFVFPLSQWEKAGEEHSSKPHGGRASR